MLVACSTGWMILVMDDRATRVLSSALAMYDVMEKRITLVESLPKSRQPFKEMDALYIISATAESVRLVMKDFESEKTAKYAGVHLYFLDKVGVAIIIHRSYYIIYQPTRSVRTL